MEFATAISQSLWAWMPSGVSNRERTCSTASVISDGKVPPLVSHRTSHSAPASLCRRQHLHRVLGVVLPPVEEVLRIEDDVFTRTAQETDRVRDDLQVLLQRDTQRFGRMQVPGLAEDADPFGVRLQQRPHGDIVLGRDACLPGRAEGHQFGMFQVGLLGRLEERLVLRIGTGISALHEVHAESVQPLQYLQFVLGRERDALGLGAISEGRVE